MKKLILFTVFSTVCWRYVNCDFINPLNFIRVERAVTIPDENITIEVSPQLLTKAGQWVNLTWYNPNPDAGDWIGAYLDFYNNGSINPVAHTPFKFQYTSYYAANGSKNGSCQFQLVNMRQRVVFGFFTGNVSNPSLRTMSTPVEFINPNEILQVHLAQGHSNSEMIVVWSTKNTTNNVVCYGDRVTAVNCVKANVSTYSASDLCGSPANSTGWSDPGKIISATMTDLKPSTRYYYVLGSEQSSFSRQFSFKTPPNPSPDAVTNMIAFGDMGFGHVDGTNAYTRYLENPSINTSKLIYEQINAGKADIVLHIGDLSYANGYSAEWDEFFYQIEPIASQVPYMVCDGNHEMDSPDSSAYYQGHDSGGECGVPYERRFIMPRPSPTKHWYGFDYGNIHVVMMSTEHDFTTNSEQHTFLDNHLKNVNRSITPWLIFAGHRPMYVDSTDDKKNSSDQPVATLLRQHVEPLLKKYGVNLAFWGHNHSYQRTCLVFNETCTNNGITHVVIGMGGAHLSDNVMSKTPAWMKVQDREHWGYLSIRTTKDQLEFQYIRDTDGIVHDYFTLKM